jgi:hypothetical protein
MALQPLLKKGCIAHIKAAVLLGKTPQAHDRVAALQIIANIFPGGACASDILPTHGCI